MKALAATADSTLVEFVDMAEPVPAADEVLVQVEAFSVNRGEIFALTGVYGTPVASGRVMGQDIVGGSARSQPTDPGPRRVPGSSRTPRAAVGPIWSLCRPRSWRIEDWAETRTVLTELNNRLIRGSAVLTIEMK
ncbi:hypothetical protein [Nocardia sp. NPDC051463]|uniref:hypothetical protein n=1 Tax=Nocardia sp. NPDC051463 TaxID=3154845 RepID=UPI003450E5FD